MEVAIFHMHEPHSTHMAVFNFIHTYTHTLTVEYRFLMISILLQVLITMEQHQ